jgi:RNA polymerase sigma-70 factor (ECF subfamily)
MRTSVVLVALQGFSQAEAAVVQKCSEGTVAWRIHEARRRLRKAFERSSLAPRSARSVFHDREGAPDLARLLLEWEIPTGLLPS